MSAEKRQWESTTNGDTTVIPLTRGRHAVIDTDDLPLVLGRAWQAKRRRGTWYAQSSGREAMHRVIMGFGPGDPHVDHIDGDGLNNRRSNLRPATKAQNRANGRGRGGTSAYKGVSWRSDRGRWRAVICIDGSFMSLGSFDSEIDAALAYDAAATEAWGEFALLNQPEAGSDAILPGNNHPRR